MSYFYFHFHPLSLVVVFGFDIGAAVRIVVFAIAYLFVFLSSLFVSFFFSPCFLLLANFLFFFLLYFCLSAFHDGNNTSVDFPQTSANDLIDSYQFYSIPGLEINRHSPKRVSKTGWLFSNVYNQNFLSAIKQFARTLRSSV